MGSACSCDAERRAQKSEAKLRVGASVGESPLLQAAAKVVDVSALPGDRALFARLAYMPFQEARLRLKEPLVWKGEARLSFTVAGGRSLSLTEEAEIQEDPNKDALDVLVTNDGGFSQRIIHSNSVLYRRYSQGRFIAQRDLDGLRWDHADQAFGLAAMGLDLIGHLVKLGEPQASKILGRKVLCIPMMASEEVLGFKAKTHPERLHRTDLKAWRKGLKLETVEGSICVDPQSGAVLSSHLSFRASRQVEQGQAAYLTLEARSGYTAIGSPAPLIQAPEEYLESLKRARRVRPATGFLDGGPVKAVPRPDAG